MFVKILCFVLVSAVFVQALRIPRDADNEEEEAVAEEEVAEEEGGSAISDFGSDLANMALESAVDEGVSRGFDAAADAYNSRTTAAKTTRRTKPTKTTKKTRTTKKTKRTTKRRKG